MPMLSKNQTLANDLANFNNFTNVKVLPILGLEEL
jgi:hypothetical protein